MAMSMYPSDQEDIFYPKEEEGGVDYFEWCASFLTAPKEGYVSPLSSASSACSSGPPSERSSPNISPYSTPEQYPPASPDVGAQYCYEPFQEESRIVMPQVFQTINIGLVQQYPQTPLSHPQSFQRSMLQLSHNSIQPLSQMIEGRNSKELLVIDQSKEVQKRKSVVLEVTPIGSEVPEFVFSPLEELNGEVSRVTMRPTYQLPQSFYRNCYEMLRMKVPGAGFEGYRVYVHQKLGYSGNAKRFKQGPDANEKAFILEGEILNQNMEPIIQCQACEEYFRDAARRILLIKNNVPIHVRNGEFQLQLKLMCCSSHHNTPFYFHFSLFDHVTKRTAMNSIFAVNVKQWKNMGSTGTKRRKTDDN